MQVELKSFYKNLKEANDFLIEIYNGKIHKDIIFRNKEFNTINAKKSVKLEIILSNGNKVSIGISTLLSGTSFYNMNIYTTNGHVLSHIDGTINPDEKKTNEDFVQLKKIIDMYISQFLRTTL